MLPPHTDAAVPLSVMMTPDAWADIIHKGKSLPTTSGYQDDEADLAVLFNKVRDHERSLFIQRTLHPFRHFRDQNLVLKLSVKRAMREHPDESTEALEKEIKQMITKGVWRGVHVSQLTSRQRADILYTSLFFKEKWTASGLWDKMKARIVVGGDHQDKSLYGDLSSPTAATSSVLAVAAIAAHEKRKVITMDVGGAFLNADMSPTGVIVHVRLDPLMTSILVRLDHSYEAFVEPNGSCVVRESRR